MMAIQGAQQSQKSLRNYIIEKKLDIEVQYAEYIAKHYTDYKAKRNLYDFIDMLEFATMSDLDVPTLDYLIIDEAQDLSTLQWTIVNILASSAEHIIIAGDDKQTINDFAGADVDTFLSLPGKVITLERSHRVPKAIYELANKLTIRMKKYRKEGSVWQPKKTTDGGSIHIVDDLPIYDMLSGTWLVLTRAAYQLEPFKEKLIELGTMAPLLFTMPDGAAPIDMDILFLANAIETFQRQIPKGFSFNKLNVNVEDGLKEQKNKMKYIKLIKKYCADMCQDLNMIDPDLIEALDNGTKWYKLFKRVNPQVLEYCKNVFPRYKQDGNNMFKDAPIRLTTIHKAKGTEADNVYVLLSIPKNPYMSMISGEDDSEAKVFYVAVTRAKHKLFLGRGPVTSKYSYEYLLRNSG